MKKNVLALSIATALSFSAQAEIIISEYIEGGSYNKAIEIANTGSSALTLGGYALAKSQNGSGEWEISLPLDDVTIAANSVYVVIHKTANDAIKAAAGAVIDSSGVVNHNGNDPIALLKNGSVHDMVGVMGGEDFAKDITLVRRVYSPSAVYNPRQWETFAKDSSSDLGQLGAEGQELAELVVNESTIMALQGSSWSSPYTDPDNNKYVSDETFIVAGVVTAIQTEKLGNDLGVGFFIQDGNGDNDPLTSDGIFVIGNISGLTVGDKVAVTGKVKEDYGWTKIDSTLVEGLSRGSTLAATALRILPTDENFDFTLERHEGMFVAFDKQSDMHVTRSFSFDYGPYRNNLMVANKRVNQHPNQSNAPAVHQGELDSAAEKQTDDNQDRRVVIESFIKAGDGIIPWYPDFAKEGAAQKGSSDDYIRIGDVIDGLEGVISYSYNDYRFYVTNQATKETFLHQASDRSKAPVMQDGDLTIATFNVLNYFNSQLGGEPNPLDQNRGAESAEEFDRQASKIVTAIVAINADILGLMEIENNGFGESSAIIDLLNRLNANLDDTNQYSIAQPQTEDLTNGFVGSDAITSQIIFKASKVSLETVRIIKMPEQHATPVTVYIDGQSETESGDNYMRDAITPTFSIAGSDEKLTISVNHLKSKGSPCWEDYKLQEGKDPDKQGSCENLRVSAAYQLGETMKNIEGNKLIMGDLNSYANEDAIMVLTNRDNAPADYQLKAARNTYIGGPDGEGVELHGDAGAIMTESYGYANVIRDRHPESHSYSYNDEVGTLDYILASASLKDKIVDSMYWNINSSESSLFEYSTKYTGYLPKYDNAYRSSDHDPAIVVLNFADKSVTPIVPVVITPALPAKVDLPVDAPQEPAGAISGVAFNISLNLLDAAKTANADLIIGDIASVLVNDGVNTRAVRVSNTTQKVLTGADFEAGYIVFEIEGLAGGDYTIQNIITNSKGEQKFSAMPVYFSVQERAAPIATESSINGGSTGILSLFALLGLGFLRRKAIK
ncbi:Endonuclease/exonuclease/phosphatase [Psychromonas ingrahamii 37]|uniref:Endonuclease/exonuclease/phosphatase n=1 Tax=Psychromonas ingrahamii (strain DSM 17664 / CCUG 51855 / 37) TaxID=357804 RepID=A1SY39_PSYIN|nr:ExeM/NucH family extracellular endonuclease [Psychromonas ingrahamii]ABM04404.1 Endonuclease/exonuclease/phosphatase [Psychromonas ingrahamii 37]